MSDTKHNDDLTTDEIEDLSDIKQYIKLTLSEMTTSIEEDADGNIYITVKGDSNE
jgi:hypothetical protein